MRCPLVTGVQTCALPISQKFAHAIRLCSRRDIELTNWKPRFKRWILFVDPFRQNGQTLFVHFREAAFDHDCFRLAICAGENLKCSVADGGHEGGMPLQHAEIALAAGDDDRSEEHTSELQSLMRISYAVFCLKKKNNEERHD